MDEAKIRLILEAMQGITYVEWKKIKHCIDMRFDADVGAVANKVPFADTNKIVDDYKREWC